MALEREKNYYTLITAVATLPLTKQVLRLGDILNTKASALLTHLSIMIIVSTALFVLPDSGPNTQPTVFGYVITHNFISLWLSGEMIVYLTATLLLLFAVRITGPGNFNVTASSIELSKALIDTAMDELLQTIKLRRKAYRVALVASVFSTVGLIAIVAIEFVRYFELINK
jgi:hypothetical protein